MLFMGTWRDDRKLTEEYMKNYMFVSWLWSVRTSKDSGNEVILW